MFRAFEWKVDHVEYIDQTKLPLEEIIIKTRDYRIIAEDIKRLAIRGAPLIGISAAFGVYLAAKEYEKFDKNNFEKSLLEACNHLASTRPTAQNLFWAIDKMKNVFNTNKERSREEILNKLLNEALFILNDDVNRCDLIGNFGNELIPENATIITHCNAGLLAVGGMGTALSPIYKAKASGKKVKVFADETRPLLQGARLTTWELLKNGIDVTLITDSTAAFLMQKEKIDLAIVGADRIALNGDAANKIGTYSLAIACKEHNIPFYIAAPLSTFDFNINNGKQIPIEERSADEITTFFGKRIAPPNVKVFSPAFDVTPNELISAIITEKGIIRKPFKERIIELAKNKND
ncbi:MAG TPA: S-methyl-5-thioribose-1-phosphate isomerase [Ignavibacteria bacterium]